MLIFVGIYLLIGALIGATLYFLSKRIERNAKGGSKAHVDAKKLNEFIDAAPVRYMVFLSIGWPVVLKWIFLRR